MGAFITFEGGEGTGKSTQARIIAQRLRASGRPVVATREPGGTPFAEAIRTRLLAEAPMLSPNEQATLFAAARADHVENVIAPALARGEWVVCDRFADSTAVYQGAAGADPALLSALRLTAVGRHEPDVTFVLDCPVAIARERLASREGQSDPFDRDEDSIQEARRAGFLALAEREPARCLIIDAAAPKNDQTNAIWDGLVARVFRRGSSSTAAR